MHRPDTPQLNSLTLLEFARQYSMLKTLGSQPIHRSRHIVVIPHPYCSLEPTGPNYEQYCHPHKYFRSMDDLLGDANATFLLFHLAWRMTSIDCYNNQKVPVIQRCVLVVHTTTLCMYEYRLLICRSKKLTSTTLRHHNL